MHDDSKQPVAWLYRECRFPSRHGYEYRDVLSATLLDHYYTGRDETYVKGEPLYTAPQASEAVRTHNDAIEAAAKVCIEIARQYDPQNSQENALASELYAAARIIRKQAKEDSAALAAQKQGDSDA